MSECLTCSPAIVCPDNDDPFSLYNVATEVFPFIFECPDEVVNCPPLGVPIFLNCCETLLTDTLPFNSTPEETQLAFQRLFAKCAALHPTCGGPGGPGDPLPPNPIQPIPVYGNHKSSCDSVCDGNIPFTYIVPAGTWFALTQEAADRAAGNDACNQAKRRKICLSALPSKICIGTPLSLRINAAGQFLNQSFQPCFWDMPSGALPAGLTFNGGFISGGQPATITGAATGVETVAFTVRVTAPNGDSMTRAYAMCTVGITPSSIPDAPLGQPYSQALTALGCAVPPLSWQISAGHLPPGLTLNEQTGVISGTPTGMLLGYSFTVRLQDQST